ncbi:Lrp/AsnC family transcriptional regulator (plasmid) [Embleya sp. NBC_00888]|uniref:Lrp/AsnC family transcriptional regulator n=1 Tax=Embleya sp. NBC_00888 TaxID=2975960 RepID=UPI00386DA2E2|nr:Lrp/AsnC family transcriptional regulator [Embleya sp. NBC_00888]
MPPLPFLDEIDHLLLDLVQTDAAQPLHELGDKVGLSPSAVQRRMSRLRRTGVIRAEVAVVDPQTVGLGLTTVALVELVENDDAQHTAFCARLRAEPTAQQCYSVLGQWDYVVVLVTADLTAYREVSRRLFIEDKTVRRYESLLTHEQVKPGLRLPLPTPGHRDTPGHP